MADVEGRRSSHRQPSSQGLSQNNTSETGPYGYLSTSGSFNQQNTPYSRSQEPWSILWYWMSAQYYQQYYYQLCSYMYYWQTLASHSTYQGSFHAQTSYSQSGLQNQRSQTLHSGQQAQQNTTNVGNQQRPLNNGGVLLPGTAVPWTFPGQPSVTTGTFRGYVINQTTSRNQKVQEVGGLRPEFEKLTVICVAASLN